MALCTAECDAVKQAQIDVEQAEKAVDVAEAELRNAEIQLGLAVSSMLACNGILLTPPPINIASWLACKALTGAAVTAATLQVQTAQQNLAVEQNALAIAQERLRVAEVTYQLCLGHN